MYKNITIRDVLQTKGFEGCKLVAGGSGLDRIIHSVTVAEVPDAMDWIRGGEFVLTTAYYVKDCPKSQEEWIQRIADSGACALGIKPNHFAGSIPDSIRIIGDKISLPIIELSTDVTWSAIIGYVSKTILERQSEIIKHFEDMSYLTKLMIESKGIITIVKALSEFIKYPVIVQDKWSNILASASCNLEDIQQLNLSDEQNSDQHVYTIKGSNSSTYGFLLVLFSDKDLPEKDSRIIEHTCSLIALEMTKERAIFEAEERLRLNILSYMLENVSTDVEEFTKKALIIGFDINGPIIAGVIRIKNSPDRIANEGNNETVFDHLLASSIRKNIEKYDKNSFVVVRHDDVVVFFHPKTKKRPDEEGQQFFSTVIENINKEFKGLELVIGIGNCYNDLSDYSRSYQEALTAVNTANTFCSESIILFSNLGYYRLLSLIKSKNELENYYHDVLGGILEHDRQNRSEFLKTLRSYLTNNGNKAAVARELYVHENTVKYRLSKIQELLCNDLNLIENKVNLFLALAAYDRVTGKSSKNP